MRAAGRGIHCKVWLATTVSLPRAPPSHDVEHRSAPSLVRADLPRASLSCPGRAKRDPGPRGGPTVCRVALGPGSSLADARSAGTREPRATIDAPIPRDGGFAAPRDEAIDQNPRCQTAQCCSFPRRVLRPGGVLVIASIPLEGWAERRQAHLCCCRVCETRLIPRSVRRGASHDAGRSPLGAPPWRFSAGGRASISGIASGSVQRAPRSQVVMPGGRGPGPPEPAVTSRSRRTPLPAPPAGSSPETPLHERGWQNVLHIRYVVKNYLRYVAENLVRDGPGSWNGYPGFSPDTRRSFRQAEISGLRGARDSANEHEVSRLVADDGDVSLAG
jgi:hypothetical protein